MILSCIIATVGLYLNSAAVIIGAMIVAPLMGPIFGFSAGMLWGSGRVIWESVTTLFKGTILVLIITSGMTYFIPGIVITEEMLGRVSPSIFDVLIALCCGFIGAYAYVNKRVSAAIPGVAISVALMPPLCMIGIGLGLLNWDMAKGAALLFCVNLVGISLAALIIFYFVRLHPKADDEEEFKKAKRRAAGHILISFIVFVIISVPLFIFMSSSIKVNLEKDSIYSAIYESIPQEQVYSIDINHAENINIDVVILADENTTKIDVSEIESMITELLDEESKLNIFVINNYKNGQYEESEIDMFVDESESVKVESVEPPNETP